MRIALLSDIHANLAAFRAVLEDIGERGGVEVLWHLGDIVGYGPDPAECIALLRGYEHRAVAGNHDWAALGRIDIATFNPTAAAAVRWTASRLGAEERAYLEGLPLRLTQDDFTLVHGSPREPVWEYLLSAGAAQANLAHFQTRFCLVGHSHLPLIFVAERGSCRAEAWPKEGLLRLKGLEERFIINPGGVGQPRDGDPRAAYALFDSDEGALRLYRVPYDVVETQKRMMAVGLPLPLAQRLSFGW